jgi:carboxylesterase type B
MFWIYGGSLKFGNAGQPGYDGSKFAAFEDVIVVSANYRINGKYTKFFLWIVADDSRISTFGFSNPP